jgi:hypothetical protein
MPSSNFHTCRLCKQSQMGLFKYGVRSYAHARCGLKKWGKDFFNKLPHHELSQFPALIANSFGLMPALSRRWRETLEARDETD